MEIAAPLDTSIELRVTTPAPSTIEIEVERKLDMAMFKAKIKVTTVYEGVIEDTDKAAATEKINENSHEWWALRLSEHDSNEVVEVVELTEEDPG